LWVLLALGAIAAPLWAAAPRMIEALGQLIYARRDRPMTTFVAFLIFSIIVYLPMRLIFGDSSWLEPGHYPLPIQASRILLYAGYFFTGVGVGEVSLRAGMLAENGLLVKRWTVWLAFAFAFYGAILLLVYAHHNWLADFNSAPVWWQAAYGLAFAMFSAAMSSPSPRFSCALRDLRFGYSTRCGPQHMASISCTSFSSSGCNTSFTIQPSRCSSNSRSCSPVRFR
jgi:hypothetical protein